MTPQAYPLSWPSFRSRTPNYKRRSGAFKRNGHALTIAEACDRLEQELERLGGKNLVISTNIEPTLSGRPRSVKRATDDPGVAVYFSLDGAPMTLACDTFQDVAQNIGGLAGHVEATRKIERYGVQSAKETLAAFAALPAPDTARNWWDVLELSRAASQVDIERSYRTKAKTMHPDAGGTVEGFQELQKARDEGLKEVAA